MKRRSWRDDWVMVGLVGVCALVPVLAVSVIYLAVVAPFVAGTLYLSSLATMIVVPWAQERVESRRKAQRLASRGLDQRESQ